MVKKLVLDFSFYDPQFVLKIFLMKESCQDLLTPRSLEPQLLIYMHWIKKMLQSLNLILDHLIPKGLSKF